MECTFVKKKQKKTNRHEKTSVFRAFRQFGLLADKDL